LQKVVGQYVMLRACEAVYRRLRGHVAEIREHAAGFGPLLDQVRPALIDLTVEYPADESHPGDPKAVAEFLKELRTNPAFPWSDLVGDRDRFGERLRSAAAKFLARAKATAPPAETGPEPALANVGGFYRDLVIGPQPSAPAGPAASTFLSDPDNPPFRCREVEGIRLTDAIAAVAAGDDWAVEAASRLHTRVDVDWGC
jgi:hypothetical protein